ncbi:tRNA pseudouridine synthase-like 1 [Megalopta genalis]|uniref:tRNA pseudouridine synthase-like 1 n=1 Tax=Megalopta genalis TaxID=115081 RepID=UPI003FD468BE
MYRYLMKFSYIGTQYRGLQKNGIKSDYIINDIDTIQGALECAFTTIIPKCINRPKLTTSSRTDIGVHAFCNAAHIDLQNTHDCLYIPSMVLEQINRYFIACHHDIRLLDFIPVSNDFNARRCAKSRSYVYRFMVPKDNIPYGIPIIERSHTYCFRSQNFDIERVKRATQLFLGRKNFETFSSLKKNVPTKYVKTIDRFTVEKSLPLLSIDPLTNNFEFWQIECSSKAFLYKQVRRMVTALLNLGAGNITEKDIICMLQVPGHHNWIQSLLVAPANGLHLINVEYSQEDIDKVAIKYNEDDVKDITAVAL